jgi:hypothetical protein
MPDPAPPLSPNELAGLRALEQAASPAPWRRGDGPSEVLCMEGIIDAAGNAVAVNCGRGAGDMTEEDEAFIIAARSAVPRLLADLEAARETPSAARLQRERDRLAVSLKAGHDFALDRLNQTNDKTSKEAAPIAVAALLYLQDTLGAAAGLHGDRYGLAAGAEKAAGEGTDG